ncbi:hypothetical protein [Sandarakinorhabdus rubra]|uniref:hypothetical protein n=1 Tax=Sandarakinorhabdus rubra TaxID=2672568 RepID=UPI0013DBDAC8|nr:hypothetical protein [Sandarakinorhabdus rubra]
MNGPVVSRLAVLGLILVAVLVAQPRLTIALEHAQDVSPRGFAMTGEVMGRTLGLMISWSGGARQLLH